MDMMKDAIHHLMLNSYSAYNLFSSDDHAEMMQAFFENYIAG